MSFVSIVFGLIFEWLSLAVSMRRFCSFRLGDDWEDMCWRDQSITETTELLPDPAETPSEEKQDADAESLTNQINSQTEIFVGKISNFRYGHTVQEVKTDCNENCRKRNLEESESHEDPKRLRLCDEKTNVITQSLRDVRVCSVDSVMDSGEGESVCSDNCGLRDLRQSSPSSIKERQMSMDSTRDSGIGENSKEAEGEKAREDVDEVDDDEDDDGTCWQPKQRTAVSKRLPGMTLTRFGYLSLVEVFLKETFFSFQTTPTTSSRLIGTFFKEPKSTPRGRGKWKRNRTI